MVVKVILRSRKKHDAGDSGETEVARSRDEEVVLRKQPKRSLKAFSR